MTNYEPKPHAFRALGGLDRSALEWLLNPVEKSIVSVAMEHWNESRL